MVEQYLMRKRLLKAFRRLHPIQLKIWVPQVSILFMYVPTVAIATVHGNVCYSKPPRPLDNYLISVTSRKATHNLVLWTQVPPTNGISAPPPTTAAPMPCIFLKTTVLDIPITPAAPATYGHTATYTSPHAPTVIPLASIGIATVKAAMTTWKFTGVILWTFPLIVPHSLPAQPLCSPMSTHPTLTVSTHWLARHTRPSPLPCPVWPQVPLNVSISTGITTPVEAQHLLPLLITSVFPLSTAQLPPTWPWIISPPIPLMFPGPPPQAAVCFTTKPTMKTNGILTSTPLRPIPSQDWQATPHTPCVLPTTATMAKTPAHLSPPPSPPIVRQWPHFHTRRTSITLPAQLLLQPMCCPTAGADSTEVQPMLVCPPHTRPPLHIAVAIACISTPITVLHTLTSMPFCQRLMPLLFLWIQSWCPSPHAHTPQVIRSSSKWVYCQIRLIPAVSNWYRPLR